MYTVARPQSNMLKILPEMPWESLKILLIMIFMLLAITSVLQCEHHRCKIYIT